MANNRNDQLLVPSLFDRLREDPDGGRALPAARHQLLHELKQSVCRDLQNLLNTRTRFVTWGPHLEELDRSLLNYGLLDFNGISLVSDADRNRFCRSIEEIIRQHEPRLLRVEVQPVSESEPIDRTLRFRIDALLRVDPAPEPVSFDSVVKPATGTVEVRGASR
jgi:type VI secretion system protein ImpF